MNRNAFIVGAVMVVVIGAGLWFFLRAPAGTENINPAGEFGTGADRTSINPSSNLPPPNNQMGAAATQNPVQKIFKISDGPVAGATFIQTLRPTTTLARYVMSESGHVADIVLDSSGAVPRAVSNTTIPGVVRALWGEGGYAAVVQYLDQDTIKTAYLGFPATSTTTSSLSRAVRLQFLPDQIADLAVSPDGKSVAYLLTTSSGVDGYVAKIDGAERKKLFSLPLSEVLITWPAQSTLITYTKSGAGAPGVAFSINTGSGAVIPLLHAEGLTVSSDRTFSRLIYQTVSSQRQTSYIHSMKSGTDVLLSFAPIPEKCMWSGIATTTLFCALPLQYVAPNYLDLWHQGVLSASDALFLFNAATGRSTILTTPGGSDGGVNSDIVELSESIDGRYLLFIRKGDRSLWGVRL